MTTVKQVDPISALQQFVQGYQDQNHAAQALEISAAYLSDMLNGRRDISDRMLQKLGLRRTVVEAK